MMPPMIGTVIRELREERNWSQDAVSAVTKIGRPHLSRIENGHSDPDLETMRRLARCFGVAVWQIVQRWETYYEGRPRANAA